MYCAVISDIHSNLEALTRVLAEIDSRKPDCILSPGDLVGYGADPTACVQLVLKRAQAVVMGNHDQAVSDVPLRESFNRDAQAAIQWTAGVLSEIDKEQLRALIPYYTDQKSGISMVHASPDHPEEYAYIFDAHDAKAGFACFSTFVCFFGHTHVPSLFSRSGDSAFLKAGKYRLSPRERYLINPGSVGQPRDRDPRASFAFFDTEKFELEIVRLDYDNHAAAEKIRRAGLPGFLADRLL